MYPRNILIVRKLGRNKVTPEMHSYDAANKLVANNSLSTYNLKAFIPIHRIEDGNHSRYLIGFFC